MLELLTDPDVARARGAPPPSSEAEADEWIRAGRERGDVQWAIERNDDGCFGGFVVLQNVGRDRGAAEAGYLLLPCARGLGLATSALVAATSWAFRERLIERVWLVHDVDNPASCNVARRAGFPRESVAVAPRRRVDGSYIAQELHARQRGERPSALPDDAVPS